VARMLLPEGMRAEEVVAQRGLVRCVFAGYFRSAPFPSTWQTPTILTLCEAAYEERLLPAGHLDPVRLAVLADALAEAGCNDDVLLTHLREEGPHVRGCFALDFLLGRT